MTEVARLTDEERTQILKTTTAYEFNKVEGVIKTRRKGRLPPDWDTVSGHLDEIIAKFSRMGNSG